jgi:uncharacterized UBP type Zn finger protein
MSERERPQIVFASQNRHHSRHSRPMVREIKADKQLITNLMEMGFTKSMCKAALKKNNNNFERSLDKLLENSDPFIGVENSESSADEVDMIDERIQNANVPGVNAGSQHSQPAAQ